VNILRRYLKCPIVVNITFFADGKEFQETDKIIRLLVLLLATYTHTNVRWEKSMRSAGTFSVLAEQL